MSWTDEAPALHGLEQVALASLNRLAPVDVPEGAVLFSPGESVKGYVIVLSGRVNVCLTGASGREMLLYSVEPGQSCIQSTLGLMGDEAYTAEAVVATRTRLVLLPKKQFLGLLDSSAGFRTLVFSAFADRIQTVMQLLEKVAFQRIESRLAAELLKAAQGDKVVSATHQELATRLGTAREVISRRLEIWSRRGWVSTTRGKVVLLDPEALRALAQES